MEFAKFIHLLKKHKYGLIGIPVLVALVTFMLMRKVPNTYASQSRLSAGLTAGSQSLQIAQQLLGGADGGMAESKINQTFSNVTQTMQLKIVMDQVSYQLIMHDMLTNEPFRKPSKLLQDLTPDARKHAIEVYTKMYHSRQSLYLMDRDQNGLNEVIKSMGYNYEALRDKIKIYRVENSDFIDVAFESDNPLLSAYVVNTLCKEFIDYYGTLNQQNKVKATEFLYQQTQQKKDSLNHKMDELKDYKLHHLVLDVGVQTKSLYSQISDFETREELAQREVEANTGAINAIDAKFSDQEKQYMEGSMMSINRDIVAAQDQLNRLNDEYIKSNFDPGIKEKIDAQKILLDHKINQSTDKYIVSPLVSKQSLIEQKLKLENDLALARNSINSYHNSIGSLNRKLQSLAPSEAVIQSYEDDIAVLSKEYLELLNRYNQSSMQLNTSVPIKVIEPALPGSKLPSKKIVSVALSGVVSAIIYLLILFIIFYLDDAIRDPKDLAFKTDSRVLGALPLIKSSFMDLQKLWNVDQIGPIGSDVKKLITAGGAGIQKLTSKGAAAGNANAEFKKVIRATRFEINMAMSGARNLVVTSLIQEEGKTLVSLSLVSAFQMLNKKVLLIDGNFLNPGITIMTQPKYFIEDYLTGRTPLEDIADDGKISVLGNKGRDVSLMEITGEAEIEQKLLELKDVFDIILVEASALNTLNQSKEWIMVADRVLCVFEANATLTEEMKDQILYLKDMDSKFIGWIMNKVSN
jgi:polysaccharide biosynthesis transport protein